MVRFIIIWFTLNKIFIKAIYIPIWLDLLLKIALRLLLNNEDLHSNMVRFIIIPENYKYIITEKFTFQYG